MASPKVVLVTGGNSGVGYETVKALLESDRAYHVLLGSRSLEKLNFAIETLHKECPGSTNTVEALHLDLTSDESIEKAFEQVKASPGHIDVLINNAGATFDIEFVAGKVSLRDCFNKAYDVNVAGAQVMTWTFMPLLLKSTDPRLLFVAGLSHMTQASEAYFPTPPQPAGWAQEGGLRDDRIPLQQDGAQHVDAGLEPQVEGGWGQGLVCRARLPGYEPGKHAGEGQGDGGWASERWWEDAQECCGGGVGCLRGKAF